MADVSPAGGWLRVPGIEQLELIGQGGFAAVYRGWQPAFNRWVAVKFIGGSHGDSPLYRFDHEKRALGSLSEHPHVVPVYEAGEAGGRPYLVMPFLTGGSLQHRMAAGPVAAAEVVVTGQAVADALAAAHRLGILHRDIKPGNVLFTGYGVPQLADFGVARMADATVTGGLMAVTVSYAAPEVLSGRPASPLSDVYSLGATLYAALRGRPAFAPVEGQAPLAQAVRVVHEDPEPLEHSGVPGPVAAVVARAMARDPAARYPSASHLRDALASVVTAARGAAPPVPLDHPPPRRLRRRLLGATTAALVLAGAGAAVAASTSTGPSGHRSRRTAEPSMGVASPPASRSPAAPPTTARTSGSTAAGDAPPSAGGATSPDELPPAVLADTLRSYYQLVDQHRLAQSWAWLTPAFQEKVGLAYYRRFWDSMSEVQVVSVQPYGRQARITLRYVATDGATSTETATLRFAIAGGHVLIDTNPGAG